MFWEILSPNRRECSCSQLTPLSALFTRRKLVQIRQVRVLTQKSKKKKKKNLTVQHLTDQREDEERGKCGESVTHKGDEMLQEPARKGKGGALPQWAGESDRAKGRNAEYVEGEKASRIYLPVCSDSDCAVWWRRRKVRGRNNGDKQRGSGRYSGLRRIPNGQLRTFQFLFFHFDWPWCLCSAFLQRDVFLAFAEVYRWYLFISLFLPVYSLYFLFSLSASIYLTCGLQFSRDITALVRREIILIFSSSTFLHLLWKISPCLEIVFAVVGQVEQGVFLLPW